jgi:hypothetical protein
MKTRYRLYFRGIRGGMFYCVDKSTGKRSSLLTANEEEARQIVDAKNNSVRQPVLNLQIAKAYLAGMDSGINTRTCGMPERFAQEALGHNSKAVHRAYANRESFEKDAAYFATLFHELIHATGHGSRLNRPTLNESTGFGSDPYCKEELIAEMGAAFLCGQAGISESILENSAAYIQNWLEQLKNDNKLIVQAAGQAQRSADFVLGMKREDNFAAIPEADRLP